MGEAAAGARRSPVPAVYTESRDEREREAPPVGRNARPRVPRPVVDAVASAGLVTRLALSSGELRRRRSPAVRLARGSTSVVKNSKYTNNIKFVVTSAQAGSALLFCVLM